MLQQEKVCDLRNSPANRENTSVARVSLTQAKRESPDPGLEHRRVESCRQRLLSERLLCGWFMRWRRTLLLDNLFHWNFGTNKRRVPPAGQVEQTVRILRP